MGWIVFNTKDPDLCWSSTNGWGFDDYDTFTDEERESLRLPLDGEWEKVPWNPSPAQDHTK